MDICLAIAFVMCAESPFRQAFQGPRYTAAERAEAIQQWQEVVGNVEVDERLFNYLRLVQPRPERLLREFAGKRLSADIVADSRFWMKALFRDNANPYANLVCYPPEPPAMGLDEYLARMKEGAQPELYVSRSRPVKYYLGRGEEQSLLFYDFQSEKYRLRIWESSAAVLVQIEERESDRDWKRGVEGKRLERILRDVLPLNRVNESPQGEADDRSFHLKEVVQPGTTFWNNDWRAFESYLRGKYPGPPDWTLEVAGFLSEKGLFVVVRKADCPAYAASPLSYEWGVPDPDWLRKDLYQADGKTPVIDATGEKNGDPAPDEEPRQEE